MYKQKKNVLQPSLGTTKIKQSLEPSHVKMRDLDALVKLKLLNTIEHPLMFLKKLGKGV